MTLQNYLCKPIIIYLVFSSICINASSKMKTYNSASEKRHCFANPTRPTAPTRPDTGCAGSKHSRKEVVLSKPPTATFGNSGDNDDITTTDTGDSDTTDGEGATLPRDPAMPMVNVKWFETNLKAQDIGVNSQGDLYVVGANGKLYQYAFLTNSYIHIVGDFELTKIFRVDVNWEGIPYVITESGDTYYLSCDHKWMRLKGCASDIGTGRGGEIFKTGCDERKSGYGIYKLFCSSPVTCDYRGCLNWRKPSNFAWTHKDSGKTCDWFRIDGNGVKIDVAPNGNPYVIDKKGNINVYNGTNWNKVSTKVKAYDLTVSNEGILMYIGQDSNIYKSINENSGTWVQLKGQGVAITAGPFGHPWVVKRIGFNVVGTAKLDFN